MTFSLHITAVGLCIAYVVMEAVLSGILVVCNVALRKPWPVVGWSVCTVLSAWISASAAGWV